MNKTLKKILYFVICGIIYAVITVSLGLAGVNLGAIPTIIILIIVFTVYKKVIKDSDEEIKVDESPIITDSDGESEASHLKMFEDYMKPEYLSKKIYTNENKITVNIGIPATITLNVEGKPNYIYCNILGSSVTVDYQTSKWNGSKEITITPVSEGETLLLFKADDFSACPILVTVSKQTSPDEAISDTAINNAQQNVNLQEKEKQTEQNNSNKKNNNSIIAEKSTPVSENNSDEDDRIWICYQQTAQTNDEKSSTKEKAVHHKKSAKTIVLTIISICLVISIIYNFYQVFLINESKEQLNIYSETIASLEVERDKYKTNAEYLDMIYHFSGSAGSVKDVYITSLGKEKGIHLDDKNYIVAKQSNQNVEIVETWLSSEFKIKPLKNGYTYVTFRNTETYKAIDVLIIVTDLSYSQTYNNAETTTSSTMGTSSPNVIIPIE